MFFLLQECLQNVLLSDFPRFAGFALLGLGLGAVLCWAAFGWGRLWNRFFRMDDALVATFAVFFVLLSVIFIPIYLALGKIPEGAKLDLESWRQQFDNNTALQMSLRTLVFERLLRDGTEDMTLIPDPRTISGENRWEFFFRDEATPSVISEVYTQGAVDSLAESHPALFDILQPENLTSALAYKIRLQTQIHPDKVFRMQDASETVHSYFLARANSMFTGFVLAVRLIGAVLYLLCTGVFFIFVAVVAYRDIKVYRA